MTAPSDPSAPEAGPASPEAPATGRAHGVGARAMRGALWSVLEKWGSRLTQLLVFVLLGRLLDPTVFGVIALASVVLDLVRILVDQGFSQAIVVEKEPDRAFLSTAFWVGLATSAALTAAMFFTAPLVADFYDEPQLVGVLRWLSLGFVLQAASSVPTALLSREFRFRELAQRRLVSVFLGGLAGVVLAACGAGVWSLVTQTLVTTGSAVAILYAATRFRPSLTFARGHWRRLVRFSGGVLGVDLMTWLVNNVDKLIVGAVLGTKALGYYYIAWRILMLVTEVMTGVMSAVALPVFSRMSDDRELTVRALFRATKLSVSLAAPIFIAVLVLAPDLVPVVFGSQWRDAVPLTQVLSVVGLVYSVTFFDRSVLYAAGRPGLELIVSAATAAGTAAAAFVGSQWSLMLVCVLLAVRSYGLWPLRLTFLHKVTGLSVARYLLQWVRPVLATAPAAGAGLAVRALLDDTYPVLRLVLAGTAMGAVFLLALLVIDRRFVRETASMLRSAGRRRGGGGAPAPVTAPAGAEG
ncbi:lipopolysaccharide biosynthesis protein [Kineococcus rhizosphaerae]|uniref:O-antigen/teichoic acid export membrane protein n=1 Tax=Kineococcus rhizosphaerae TaxID=559628 RepID=A0A2T0R112_9ACTN|nr:lipopolysaccharide biosynthesis protein [Kineococcus rhizosphaerae]PRY12986.1 O-antigen/teichoic acid export membrane protein [Kineococcus rhizosphaerae]